MPLNKADGNMYTFLTHTWNPVKGHCLHNCSYCYMHQEQLKPIRFDQKELKTDFTFGKFIFVGSGCDLFASDIPDEWIKKTLDHCENSNRVLFHENKFLFQSKNPARFLDFIRHGVFRQHSVLCTTIESNRFYQEIMNQSPPPEDRVKAMEELSKSIPCYVTIEPILDFDLEPMVKMIRRCKPIQVNIGADSQGHRLPEPSKEKVMALIAELETFTVIDKKRNLDRILRS